MSLKTNNFFIEIEGYNKPSGLSVTTSDFYIFSDTINYYLIKTDILKEIIKTSLNKKLIFTKDKLTIGYLLNKFIIINSSELI
jgi:hypothetical protein